MRLWHSLWFSIAFWGGTFCAGVYAYGWYFMAALKRPLVLVMVTFFALVWFVMYAFGLYFHVKSCAERAR